MKKPPIIKATAQQGTLRGSALNRLIPSAEAKAPRGPKAPRPKQRKTKRPLLAWLVKWSFIGGIWAGVVGIIGLLYISMTLPDINQITVVEKKPSITITTENGDTLAKYGDLYGEYVDYAHLPPQLVHAVLAIEDRRFFHHFGIDPWGLARAFYVNFREGRVVQGGSTITQQLAKISFLTPKRTLGRKLREVVLALWLEKKLSKEQIITLYLNKVYLGSGNYGVSAASRYYFDKRVQDINVNEAAILAGLLKAPTKYSPANNPELAKQRAQLVLGSMVEEGYLTQAQREQEKRFRPAAIDRGIKETLKNPYFADWILEKLPDYIGSSTSDVTITTTLDMQMQRVAEANLVNVLNTAKAPNMQGALVALSPEGKVLAMVGGRDYYQSQFNRAVKAKRQPGSTFKLFVYLTAFEQGYSPYDQMEDSPVRVKHWSPQNYGGKYEGNVTLLEAFTKSINTVAVKLSEKIGRDNVIALAHRMGIHSPMESLPSIALGSTEVNLLELTGAYAHLANNGMGVVPYSVVKVTDKEGNILYQHQGTEQERIVSGRSVAEMNRLLINVIDNGTGKAARLNRVAAGKTGTTQDFRDAWFIGYTPDLVTGVWVGNDDNAPMNGVTGGKFPAQIWKGFMNQALAGHPERELPISYGGGGGNTSSRDGQGRHGGSFWNELWGSVFGR